jgi:ABC-type thiamine transport system substrate-binding protein
VAPSAEPVASTADAAEGSSITVVAHDAFAVSDDVLAAFEEQTGVSVEVLTSNDAATMVAQATLDDLASPSFERELVVQNPETSSPGFAFLLATIERYGDGWEAYYTEFAPYGGDRPLVVSYASSPVAEVIFADPSTTEAPTAVMEDSCFRQIEYAGVLNGTDQPEAAAAFVEFMLSGTFQEDVPLNMFVFPVSTTAALPPEFEEFASIPASPATQQRCSLLSA